MPPSSHTPSTPAKRRGSYRRWSKGEKRRIVEETLEGGASVSVVARRHDANANQVFTWRQQYQRRELGKVTNALVVSVGTIGTDGRIHPEAQRETAVAAKASLPTPATPAVSSRIEIELPGGIKVHVDGDVQEPVLGRVVKLVRGLSC